MSIGDAYKLVLGPCTILGRIIGFDETSPTYYGEYSIIRFATPGGSIFRANRNFLCKITTEEDFAELRNYEKLAQEKTGSPYCGLIELQFDSERTGFTYDVK